MNEQPKSKRMELIRFGKGQGFAHEAGQALAQGVEPALDMSGLTTGLTHRLMPVGGENTPVSLPKITERVAARVGARNASQRCRQLASLRSPMKYATIWRVRRHSAPHTQR
jgi:hypothetical protein